MVAKEILILTHKPRSLLGIPKGPSTSVEINRKPRQFFIEPGKRASFADIGDIYTAMVGQMDGTWFPDGNIVAMRPNEFEVTRVYRGIRGKDKTKRLKHWRFEVKERHRKEVKHARTDLRAVLNGVTMAVLSQEQADYNTLVQLDPSKKVKQGALNAAEIILGDALLGADRRLRPGEYQVHLEREVRNIFLRLEDGKADPFNVVHGLFEGIRDARDNLSSNNLAQLGMQLLFARSPMLNTIFNEILPVGNKWTSRDPFATKVASTLYAQFYTGLINHPFFTEAKGVTKLISTPLKVTLQRLLPTPDDFDAGEDRVTTRQDLVALAGMERIFTAFVPTTAVEGKHRTDLAQAAVHALSQQRTVLEKTSRTINQAVSGTQSNAAAARDKVLSWMPGPIKGLVEDAAKLLKLPVNKKSSATDKARQSQAEIFNTSSSMLDYYTRFAAEADALSAMEGLKPIDVESIRQAKVVADQVLRVYQAAQKLVA